MADVIVMPQLGNTVESCLVTTWHVAVGDTVQATTVVADIETDKSTMEVPATRDGVILALLANAGDEVQVKAPFFIVGDPGEALPEEAPVLDQVEPISATSPDPSPDTTGEDQAPINPEDASGVDDAKDLPSTSEESVTSPMSPRARRILGESGIHLEGMVGSGPHGRIIADDVEAALVRAGEQTTKGDEDTPVAPSSQQTSSPADVAVGTGLGGRLTRADREARRALGSDDVIDQPTPTEAAPADFPGTYTDTPLKGIRALVADRMNASMTAHAQLTFDASASATALLGLRARFKASEESLGLRGVTIGDLVAFAAVRTATRFASINATLENRVLRAYDAVHLGLAVDTARGLLVPTIRNASNLSLTQFSAQSKALAAEAQTGKINPDLLAGATFTVTNLGAYGIESFTPILNSPQVAILGVNAITPRPVITDGGFGVEQRISFSLTVDHAVVDGADAARYLQALTAFIADIDLMILTQGGTDV